MLQSDISKELLAYWMDVVRKLGKPTIDKFDPVEIPPNVLPHVFIAHLEYDPFQVRIGLQGTFINDRVGQNLTGQYLDQESFGVNFESILGLYKKVANDGISMMSHERILSSFGTEIVVEVVHMPVWGIDGKIAQVVGSIDIINRSREYAERFEANIWHLEQNRIIGSALG